MIRFDIHELGNKKEDSLSTRKGKTFFNYEILSLNEMKNRQNQTKSNKISKQKFLQTFAKEYDSGQGLASPLKSDL